MDPQGKKGGVSEGIVMSMPHRSPPPDAILDWHCCGQPTAGMQHHVLHYCVRVWLIVTRDLVEIIEQEMSRGTVVTVNRNTMK